tara:strand:+ start:4785 stop:5336 length:552 start_codon:yes stop_codon:yes gene_type:complete
MTKIYTKNGDEGETNLFLGGKLSKNDIRVEAFGTVDELVSSLGFAKTLCENPKVIETLEMLQHSLFKIGAELSSDSEKTVDIINVITKDNVNEIEKLIDSITESVDLGNEFIMPGTSSSSAAIDISRTIARRLERVVVSINNDNKINKFILVYLNRISDLLFVLGRLEDEGKKIKKIRGIRKK